MKADRNITALVLLFLACITLSAQSNKVYWIHGLKGTSDAMTPYREMVADNQQGEPFSWPLRRSMAYAGFALDSTIKVNVAPSKSAIVVGYSAGGLVARRAKWFYGNRIRSIITLGTPHNGAPIAAQLQGDGVSDLISRVVNMIVACRTKSTSAMVTSTGIIDPVSTSIFYGIAQALNFLGSSLFTDLAQQGLNEYSGIAAQEMVPGSSFLNTLNNSYISVPIISIYGNEDEKRLIRLLGCFKKEGIYNAAHYPNLPILDESYIGLYNATVASTAAVAGFHYVNGVAHELVSFLNPSHLVPMYANFDAAAAWRDMNRFLEYDIHNEWDEMIGSYHYEQIETHHQFLWWHWTDVEYVKVYEDSDGFIPNKYSHIDSSMGGYVRNIKVDGVNHLEMTAHKDIFNILSGILNGTQGQVFNPNYN